MNLRPVQRQKLSYLAYPPTVFPVRDLFLLDWVPISETADVLEIGVGCGETTARVASMVRRVVGVDIAEEVLGDLRYLELRHTNLSFRSVDVTTEANLPERFGIIISFDTLEHIPDPVAYFGFIARHLSRDGTAHILFPNETHNTMHGITRFASEDALRAAIGDSLSPRVLQVAEISAWVRVVQVMSYQWVRALAMPRRPHRRWAGPRPQTFDQTRFYRHMGSWQTLSPFLNAYWFFVLGLCRLKRPSYHLRPLRRDDFDADHNLYIVLTH